jgi:GAF domain-containing protein
VSVAGGALQAITDELLERTRSSRVTLRQASPKESFPITQESVAPGVRPIKGDRSIDLGNQPVVKILQDERRVVIQEDSRRAISDPEFHKMLDLYQVAAQIVAPVYLGNRLVAMLSVHHAEGPRTWTADEISMVWQAVERVRAHVDRSGGELDSSAVDGLICAGEKE